VPDWSKEGVQIKVLVSGSKTAPWGRFAAEKVMLLPSGSDATIVNFSSAPSAISLFPVGETRGGWFATKPAVTFLFSFMVRKQIFATTMSQPSHLSNGDPSPSAVRAIGVLEGKEALQVLGQAIPTGDEVITPLPMPRILTIRV